MIGPLYTGFEDISDPRPAHRQWMRDARALFRKLRGGAKVEVQVIRKPIDLERIFRELLQRRPDGPLAFHLIDWADVRRQEFYFGNFEAVAYCARHAKKALAAAAKLSRPWDIELLSTPKAPNP